MCRNLLRNGQSHLIILIHFEFSVNIFTVHDLEFRCINISRTIHAAGKPATRTHRVAFLQSGIGAVQTMVNSHNQKT